MAVGFGGLAAESRLAGCLLIEDLRSLTVGHADVDALTRVLHFQTLEVEVACITLLLDSLGVLNVDVLDSCLDVEVQRLDSRFLTIFLSPESNLLAVKVTLLERSAI